MKTNRKSEMKTQRKTGTMAKNKAGRTGLLRKGIIMVLAMAAALSLIGCSGTKLSGDFDEEKVKAAAQEAIDHLVAGEYEACVSLMDEEMQAAISAGSGRQYGGHERAERRLSGVQELLRGGAEGQGRHRVRGSRGDSRF